MEFSWYTRAYDVAFWPLFGLCILALGALFCFWVMEAVKLIAILRSEFDGLFK